MTIIDRALLDRVSAEAKGSARLRKNLNFHESNDAPCQRLLNAIEPGTYIRPHRHDDPTKGETFLVVRGRLGLLVFDEAGRVTSTHLLEAGGATIGADVPAGTFHSLVSFEEGTIFFEAKAGPYAAAAPGEFASWAPAEGEAGVGEYRAWMEGVVVGGK